MKAYKKYIAEFLGTMALVVFGCGTAIALGCGDPIGSGDWIPGGYLLTALAFGLVLMAMAYSIGNVSGCHINPAVSVAMLMSKRMSFSDFIGYIAAQFAGGICGSLILLSIFGRSFGFGANALCFDNTLKTILIEIMLTAVFVFTILGVTSKPERANISGLIIGLTLTLVHIFGIRLTGTSVNPARSFGPALIAGGDALKNVWVFIVAPMIGGVLAALAYGFLDKAKTPAKQK